MRTRHSTIQKSPDFFIVTMKVEPDNDADRRLLIEAFDHEPESYDVLIKDHIVNYVRHTFPGMKVAKADHERYPTLLKVYLQQQPAN